MIKRCIKFSQSLWDANRPPNPSQKTRPSINKQEKKNLSSREFCCSSKPQNENKIFKKYKYLDLAQELKKLWNIKVTFIPITVSVLGTDPKGFEKRLEQITTLLRSARILKRVLETRFGLVLVSLFNGILTFVGYLMLKLFS